VQRHLPNRRPGTIKRTVDRNFSEKFVRSETQGDYQGMKPVRVASPIADPVADVVSLHAWAEPSHRFAQLCDDASSLLTGGNRNDPALSGIAAELTSTLEELTTIDKPSAKTRHALGILISVANHTQAEVFGALNWIKRLGSIRQQPTTPTATTRGTTTATPTVTHRAPRNRRTRRTNHDQQTLWSDQ
jgi:hypothetical protein